MGISHFAKLNDSNVVTDVLVLDDANTGGPDDTEDNTGQNFLRKRLLEPTAVWKRADINTFRNTHSSGDNSKAFRGNYPGKNYTYDEAKNVFIPPKPYPSWILNESTWTWDPPTPKPEVGEDDRPTVWDEASQSWLKETEPGSGVFE